MTHLRKMMLEELQRRNYAETTIECYLRTVEDFSRHFHCSPDRLRIRWMASLCPVSRTSAAPLSARTKG